MMKLFSPAKINLTLKVHHKRSDGYHEISTLMQTINLCDIITLQSSDHDYLNSNIPDNLIIKALSLFRKKTQIHTPVRITLEKRIPLQAGLGGGSSNAATTLWGLNKLFNSPVNESQLQEWSAEIGSDVPFFFSSGTALCQGRGEKVTNQEPSHSTYWIVKPAIGLSTAEVYKTFKETASSSNDLEPIVLELIPALAELKQTLQHQGFHNVQMSGSGTAFFCQGSKRPEIKGSVYRVSTINRIPFNWFISSLGAELFQ